MKIAEASINNRITTLFITLLVVAGGLISYDTMGRLEDPEFTIKDAKVITQYPGATAEEVEKEVTDRLETAIQQMGQLKWITSQSMDGLSIITPTMKDQYGGDALPQVWDELRRKVGDIQNQLPPGAGPSVVNDDFGDVFGVFYAITGRGYSYRELKDFADLLQRELLLVPDVGKISLWGAQPERIYVEISRQRIAQLGIPLKLIYSTIGSQNAVTDAGSVSVGSERLRLEPTGDFGSVEAIGDVLIPDPSGQGRLIYVRDVATISRGYEDPPERIMRFDGEPAIGLGISTAAGGNVVAMGEAVKQRIEELQSLTPVGMELHPIYIQGDAVTRAIDNFVVSLYQAVAIVIVVLMLFMGLRSASIIGVVLVVTILATLIVMKVLGISMERISLGALIISLGMLVDNAIVVTDGMLAKVNEGMNRIKAANEVVGQNAIPLLGATIIAVLAFAPIGLSDDNTGEYCRSLFVVILTSLMLSWVSAITLTPLLCHLFLKEAKLTPGSEPYGGAFYNLYRGFLKLAIRLRYVVMVACVLMLVAAGYGFGFLKNSFFPPSTQPQFQVHYWAPQGSDIRATSAAMADIEGFLLAQEGIVKVSTFVGQGAMRFQLTYGPENTNPSYGLFLVEVDDYRKIDQLAPLIYTHIVENYPNAQPGVMKFALGPGAAFKIRARLSGPDPETLRALGEQVRAAMTGAYEPQIIQLDWREQVKVLSPRFSEAQARRTGITRDDLSTALAGSFDGVSVGLYREANKLIPIVSRPPVEERADADNINEIQIWSPVAERAIPLRQVVSGFGTHFSDGIIMRRNRVRTVEVRADVYNGELPSTMFEAVRPAVEAIQLPPGYTLVWGGEHEDSARAQGYLMANIPVPLLIMVMILVTLFNSIRQPLVILLTVPLSLVGVVVGLLIANEAFGFMAVLGFLSLSGMLIKNAIVLIDQINLLLAEGYDPLDAIVEAGVTRMRPVLMAAATTVLGMLPLFADPFYIGMAVTIIGGLSFATLLTLIVVPVLHATFFGVSTRGGKSAEPTAPPPSQPTKTATPAEA